MFSHFSSWFGLSKPKSENNATLGPTSAPTPVPATAPESTVGASSGNDTLPTPQQLERPPYPPVLSPRSLKQLGLYFGGTGFLVFSIIVTRRAVRRYQLASQLKFFQPNNGNGRTHNGPPEKDPLMALQALSLATLNTASFAIMMAGGISWAFDISSIDDLKRLTRRSIHAHAGQADQAAEDEVAQWVAKTLGIKEKPPSSDHDNSKS